MAKYDGRIGYTGKEIRTPVKAIRAFCIECAGADSKMYIKTCGGNNCPLFPFRFGVNPYHSHFNDGSEEEPETSFPDEE